MAKSINISVLATSIILVHLSAPTQAAVIDCVVLRETDLAVMIAFLDEDQAQTGKTSWLPKKALEHKTVLGSEVYEVYEWFETLDGVSIDSEHEHFGYMVDRI